jgi:hypothetical protein
MATPFGGSKTVLTADGLQLMSVQPCAVQKSLLSLNHLKRTIPEKDKVDIWTITQWCALPGERHVSFNVDHQPHGRKGEDGS